MQIKIQRAFFFCDRQTADIMLVDLFTAVEVVIRVTIVIAIVVVVKVGAVILVVVKK